MGIKTFLLLVIAGTGQLDEKALSAERILERALEQRRAITSATVELHCLCERPNTDVPSSEEVTKIWMDGERRRNDLFSAKGLGAAVARDSLCRNCEKDGEYVIYRDKHALGMTSAVNIGKLTDRQADQLMVMDPRVLGLTPMPWGTMWSHRIDEHLKNTDRTIPAMEHAKWKENDCYIIRYTRLSDPKIKMTIWVVPSMDFSVARVEAEGESNGGRWQSVIESDLKRYGKSGIWYPKSCSYSSKDRNAKEFQHDTITVSEASFNDAIPAKIFQLSGMDIRPGTRVKGSALPQGNYRWDGKAISKDTTTVAELPGLPDGSPASSARPWLWLVAGAFLMIIAAGALLLCFRKRSPQADNGQ